MNNKKPDQRTLTNQPDPPDFGKSTPKRIRTQIHRRTPSSGPLAEQWDADTQAPPDGLRTPANKMVRRSPRERP
jgi:hypothetical protein